MDHGGSGVLASDRSRAERIHLSGRRVALVMTMIESRAVSKR
jgi:hypothetical protein